MANHMVPFSPYGGLYGSQLSPHPTPSPHLTPLGGTPTHSPTPSHSSYSSRSPTRRTSPLPHPASPFLQQQHGHRRAIPYHPYAHYYPQPAPPPSLPHLDVGAGAVGGVYLSGGGGGTSYGGTHYSQALHHAQQHPQNQRHPGGGTDSYPPQYQPYPGPTSMTVVYTDDATTKRSDCVRRRCFNCRTTDTSTWRRSKLSPGKVLCNKCGLFERTHSRPRPPHFSQKRGPLSSFTLPSYLQSPSYHPSHQTHPPAAPPPQQNYRDPYHKHNGSASVDAYRTDGVSTPVDPTSTPENTRRNYPPPLSSPLAPIWDSALTDDPKVPPAQAKASPASQSCDGPGSGSTVDSPCMLPPPVPSHRNTLDRSSIALGMGVGRMGVSPRMRSVSPLGIEKKEERRRGGSREEKRQREREREMERNKERRREWEKGVREEKGREKWRLS